MFEEKKKNFINLHKGQSIYHVSKRGSLLGNEEHNLGGDLPIFEIEYSDFEQMSIFSKKSPPFYVRMK